MDERLIGLIILTSLLKTLMLVMMGLRWTFRIFYFIEIKFILKKKIFTLILN